MLIYLDLIDSDSEKLKFTDIYECYRGLMFYIANRILNNEMDAEDAVHEAFVSIAENISKICLRNAHKTRAYIVTIVEHKAIDIYRKKNRANAADIDDFPNAAVFPAPEEGQAAQAMSRLPAKHRQVLYLKHFCGFKSKEIAKMLDMSDDMVRRTLSDARAALRKELEKEGIEV